MTLPPPSNRRVPRRMTSKGEGGWALWRPQGSRRPDRWPPGRCPFRDTWRIRGLRRPTADPGTQASHGGSGTQAATADPGTQAATADPGTQAATADPGTQAATADPGTQAATADPGA